MTKEDKQLLLKDLCARLPYNAIVYVKYSTEHGSNIRETLTPEEVNYELNFDIIELFEIDEILVKPYLRPMSDMTEEERKEFMCTAGYEVEESINGRHYEYYLKDCCVGTLDNPSANYEAIDWLNAHHFDYRGLIEKGLAIAAIKKNNPYA